MTFKLQRQVNTTSHINKCDYAVVI